jgi:hypothetical protein
MNIPQLPRVLRSLKTICIQVDSFNVNHFSPWYTFKKVLIKLNVIK